MADGRPAMGMNISGNDDYGAEIHFADLMMMSRNWYDQSGQALSTSSYSADANGYPTQVPQGAIQTFGTIMEDGGVTVAYPAGLYTFILKGTGKVYLWGDGGNKVYTSPGVYSVSIDPTLGDALHIVIQQSSASDPVNGIHLVMPGYSSCAGYDPANPAACLYQPFLQSLQGMSVLRFMDAMRAFGPAMTVNDVIPPTYYTQSRDVGMAPEIVAAICNAVNADCWVNVPRAADDGWVTAIATRLKATLNPNLKVYVEYFDEIWNNTSYPNTQAAALGLTCASVGSPSMGYQIYRSAAIWQDFQNVFGGLSRIVRVAGGWFAVPWSNAGLMSCFQMPSLKPAGNTQVPDVLAVGSYFYLDDINSVNYSSTTVSDIDYYLNSNIQGTYKKVMNGATPSNNALALQYHVRLVAYEAGQGLAVPFGPLFSNTALKNLMIAANRDQGMYNLYQQMFNTWYGNGGELFIHYNDVGAYSQYGSWGARENLAQTPAQAPKWRAILDELASINSGNHPPLVTLTGPSNGTDYPNGPASIPISATVTDAATITKVEFYQGNTLLGTDTAAPYAFTWNGVALGTYTVTAKAYDSNGLFAASLGADVTVGAVQSPVTIGQVSAALANVRVYPNPWRKDRHAAFDMIFDQMPAGSTVKIFTVSGHKVRELGESSGMAKWDLKNQSGDRVASGLYFYVVDDGHGNTSRGKIAVIQ